MTWWAQLGTCLNRHENVESEEKSCKYPQIAAEGWASWATVWKENIIMAATSVPNYTCWFNPKLSRIVNTFWDAVWKPVCEKMCAVLVAFLFLTWNSEEQPNSLIVHLQFNTHLTEINISQYHRFGSQARKRPLTVNLRQGGVICSYFVTFIFS